MIKGQLNRDRQAIITVTVHGPDAQQKTTEVIIDTGFSGFLSLPLSEITALKLVYDHEDIFLLGDNKEELFAIYVGAEIEMDGGRQPASVLAAEGDPMIGLALLDGYRLCLDFENSGEVRLERLP